MRPARDHGVGPALALTQADHFLIEVELPRERTVIELDIVSGLATTVDADQADLHGVDEPLIAALVAIAVLPPDQHAAAWIDAAAAIGIGEQPPQAAQPKCGAHRDGNRDQPWHAFAVYVAILLRINRTGSQRKDCTEDEHNPRPPVLARGLAKVQLFDRSSAQSHVLFLAWKI